MIKGLLIDLDGTLVDTSALDALRQKGDWKACVARAGKTRVFDDVISTLSTLRDRGTKIAVVTTSVSYYASAMLKHHGIPFDAMVAYHDVKKTKPAPDPYLRAVTLLGVDQASCVGVGDGTPDIFSLRAAGITAIGAGWSPVLVNSEDWDRVLRSPADLLKL